MKCAAYIHTKILENIYEKISDIENYYAYQIEVWKENGRVITFSNSRDFTT